MVVKLYKKGIYFPKLALLFLFVFVTQTLKAQVQFTPGNIVVEQVGTGSGSLGSTGTALFLKEYTTTTANQSSPVQAITIPTSGANRLVSSGSATSEGQMTLSADSTKIVMPGYDTTTGVSGIASTASTSIARAMDTINILGNVSRAVTSNSFFNGNNLRGCTRGRNDDYWGAGTAGSGLTATAGINYFGNTTTAANVENATTTNTRVVNTFNGNLYYSTGSGTIGIYQVGSGLPTTSSTATLVVGISSSNGTSPYGFSINPASTVMYIADDGAGISKYTYNGTSWSFSYFVTTTTARGLAVDWSGTNAVIYATTAATNANTIIKVTDNGANSTVTVLATAPTNTAFRGIAFAPSCVPSTVSVSGSTSLCPGSTVTLTANTITSSGITYQWQLNGSNITGATSSSYIASQSNPGSYTVKVSTSNCTTTSAATSVTANTAPSISAQPSNAVAAPGGNTSFTVNANGTNIAYQWQLNSGGGFGNITNGAPYSNATAATLNITGATAGMNGYLYRCIISGTCTPSDTSGTAALYIMSLTGTTVCPGSLLTFSSVSTPTQVVWNLNGSPILTTTSQDTLTVTTPGVYTVTATISGVQMTTAGYTINPAPSITLGANPSNCFTSGTTNAVLTYSAVSGTPTTYNIIWSSPFVSVSNVSLLSSQITIPVPAGTAVGTYTGTLLVSNAAGCSSAGIPIADTVYALPSITVQPSNTVAFISNNASISLTATGTNLSYQWQVNTGAGFSNITNGGVYSGATSNTLTITGALVSMNTYQYQCIVTGSCTPSVTSSAITLTVETPQFTVGNIVVIEEEISGSSGVGTAMVLKEYNTSSTNQSPVSTFALPTTGTSRIVNSGTSTSEGHINLSLDSSIVTVVGYDAAVGTSGVSSSNAGTVARVVDTVNILGNVGRATSSNTFDLTTSIRHCVKGTGNDYWVVGAGSGLCYFGNAQSAAGPMLGTTNDRCMNITGGNIYLTTASSGGGAQTGILKVTGTPKTTGQTFSQYLTSSGGTSPYTFAINSTETVAYIGDDGAGVQKYTRANTASAWSLAYTYNNLGGITNNAARAIIVDWSGANPIIYVTTTLGTAGGSTTSPNYVLKIVDNGSLVSSVISILATSSTGNFYRGIQFTPMCVTGTITASGSTAVCPGSPVTLNANTLITTGLSYQWQLNGTNISGATGSSYAASTAGSYTVMVSTSKCTRMSGTTAVTLDTLPSITTQPVSSSQICLNGNDSFTITATGTGLAYQWQVNTGGGFTSISNNSTYSGANTNKLVITGGTSAMNNYQYQCIVSGACTPSVTSTTSTLTVLNPPSISTQPVSQTICANTNTSFTVGATGPGLSYQWYIYNGSFFTTISNSSIYSGATTNTLTITGATASMNGSIYQCLVSGTCTPPAVSNNDTLTVNPIPSVTTATTASACSGTNPNISLTASTPSTFAWTLGTNTGSITGASAGSGSTIGQVLTNPSNSTAGSIVYNVVPTSIAGSCVGSATAITVTVNPIPSVTTATTATICSGTSPNISLTASAGSTFAWTIGTITGAISGGSASSGSVINQILTDPSNAAAGTIVYNVTPTSTIGSCVGSSTGITVTVNPAPGLTTASTASICSGTSPNISLTASMSSTFAWTLGTNTGGITGASAGSGSTIGQVLTNPSNSTAGSIVYNVTPTSTVGSCAGLATAITVTVNPIPSVTTAGTASTCSGTGPNISLTASAGSTFAWTLGTNTGGITGASAGSGSTINQILTDPSNSSAGSIVYNVTPASTAGSCVGSTTGIAVTVNPAPILTSTTTASVCSGNGPNISLTASAGSTFTWTLGTNTGGITGASSGSGSTINQALTNPSNSTAGSIVYNVTPIATIGSCSGATTGITVTVNPSPSVTTASTASTCSGASPNISLTASVGSSFAWTLGTNTGGISGASAGSGSLINQILTDPSNSAAGSIIYNVTPTSTVGSCAGSAKAITVTVNPTPGITTATTATTCSGTGPNISLTASTGSTFAWTLGTNTGGITGASAGSGSTINQILTDPSNSAAGSIIYNVVPTSTVGSCVGSSIGITVTVNPAPSVTTASTASICSGSGPNISLIASAGSTFSWTLGTNTGGITGASAGSGSTINQVLTDPSNSAAGSIVYNVTPTSTVGSCAGSPKAITVTVNPIPSVTTATTASICNGTGPNISLTASTGSTFAWTLGTNTGGITGASAGSGSIINQVLTDPSNSVAGSIVYNVIPTSTVGSCAGSSTGITVTVNPSPGITNVSTASICSGSGSNISLTASIGSTFTWTLGTNTGGISGASAGSGSTINQVLTNPSNSSAGSIVYNVTPASTIGSCAGATTAITVTVNPIPSVTTANTASTCSGTGPNISLTASMGSTFAWTLGANIGGISGASASSGSTINQILNNPSNSSAGSIVYNVTPTSIIGSCAGQITPIAVAVNPVPVITSGTTDSICSGTNTNISLTASAGSTFAWTLGTNTGGISGASAGSGSTINQVLIDPSNSTAGSIVYNVTTTSIIGSCAGPATPVTVAVDPIPTVNSIPNIVICNGSPSTVITFSGLSLGGTVYNWTNNTPSIGLAASGTGNIASFVATNAGNTAVVASIIVTPAGNGCFGASQNFTITVNPTPVADAILNQAICNGSSTSPVSFTGSVAGAVYNWTNNTPSIGLTASGSGNIASFTAVNSSNAPVTANISVTPSANSCAGTTQSFAITVNPTPAVTAPGNIVVCNGANIPSTIISGTVTGATYNWTNTTTSIGLNANGSGNIPAFTGVNSTNLPVTASVTISPVANSCTGTSQSFTITVNPTPGEILPANQVFCNGVTTNTLSFSSTTPGTTYSWTNNTTSIGLGASGTGNITPFTATNLGTSPVFAIVSVSPSANSCAGNSQTFTIVVNPTPGVTLPSSIVVCNGTTTPTLSFGSSVNGVTYSWTNNASIGLPSSGIGNISPFTATNNTSSPVVATIFVIPTANSCTGNAQSFTITVNPTPSVTTPSNQVLCNGSSITPVTFSGSLVNSTSYNWTNNSTSIGLGASGSGNISSFNVINNGTAPVIATLGVTPTANGCAGTQQNFTITVNPTPQLSSSVTPMSSCSNAAFTYAPSSTTTGTSYSWSRASVTNISPATGSGNGNVNEVLINSTSNPLVVTYVYTLSANGCTNSQNLTDTVKPTPVLNSTVSPMSSCSNSLFSYIPSGATYGTTFNWSRSVVANITPSTGSGTGDISETLVNTTTAPIVVSYTYAMLANGCSNTQVITDTVKPLPVLNSSLTGPTVCSGANITYTATSATAGVVYSWNRAFVPGVSPLSGSGNSNVINETINNGTPYPVVVSYVYNMMANGCSSAQTVNDTVKPVPTMNSSLTPPAVCNNTAFSYVPASATPGTTFAWNRPLVYGISNIASSGAGNPNEVLTDTIASSVNVTYIYTLAANGCANPNPYNVTVSVNKQPSVVTQPLSSTICAGSNINISMIAGGTNPAYQWLVDTGTGFHVVADGGVYSGATTNTLAIIGASNNMNGYVYQCAVSGVCAPMAYTIPVSLTVNGLPTVSSQPANTTVCSGSNAAFSISATGAGISYQWQENTGSGFYNVSNNSIYSGANTNTLTITGANSSMNNYLYRCVVSGTCAPSATSSQAMLFIHPNPLPPVIASGPSGFCVGDSVNLATIASPNYSYQWQMNGTNIAGATASAYEVHNGGTYTVQVLNNFGCTATSNNEIVNVNAYPSATITDLLGTLTFCAGDSVILGTNSAQGLTYQWLKNGTSIPGATNVTFATGITGNYTVNVSNNGCVTHSSPVSVTALPLPSSNLIVPPHPVICSSAGSLQLSATAAQGQTYLWYYNGLAILGSTDTQISATQGGWYSVKVSDNISGCFIFTPEVYIAYITSPVPVITANGLILNAGFVYTSYQWYENGNIISGETNETLTVTQNGIYSVTVADTNGCTGSSYPYTVTNVGLGVANIKLTGDDIRIYPNPATSVIHFDAPAKINVSIMSIEGKEVIHQDNVKTTDITPLVNGVYMIRVFDEDGILIKTERLVKDSW